MRLLVLAHAPSVHTRRWVDALASRGHELRLLTVEPPSAPLAVPWRIVGLPIPLRPLRYASAVGAVRDEIRSFRPDVTVAHFVPNYGLLAARAGARPLAVVAWGSDLLINAWRTPLHRARARFALSRADLVHVDAEVLAAAAERLGVPRARLWVRAWGVDVDALAPRESWERRRAAGAALRVLSMRQLEAIYQPDLLIRALGFLARSGVPFRATIGGTGSLRDALERMARDEGIADSVRFAGWVDPGSLAEIYRAHDVYVSLSRSDSTSQALLEAMAAGLVPVVSDIAGNREWVTHRREGLLVPVRDSRAVASAIQEIAGDFRAAAALAEGARARAVGRARFADTVAMTEERLQSLV